MSAFSETAWKWNFELYLMEEECLLSPPIRTTAQLAALAPANAAQSIAESKTGLNQSIGFTANTTWKSTKHGILCWRTQQHALSSSKTCGIGSHDLQCSSIMLGEAWACLNATAAIDLGTRPDRRYPTYCSLSFRPAVNCLTSGWKADLSHEPKALFDVNQQLRLSTESTCCALAQSTRSTNINSIIILTQAAVAHVALIWISCCKAFRVFASTSWSCGPNLLNLAKSSAAQVPPLRAVPDWAAKANRRGQRQRTSSSRRAHQCSELPPPHGIMTCISLINKKEAPMSTVCPCSLLVRSTLSQLLPLPLNFHVFRKLQPWTLMTFYTYNTFVIAMCFTCFLLKSKHTTCFMLEIDAPWNLRVSWLSHASSKSTLLAAKLSTLEWSEPRSSEGLKSLEKSWSNSNSSNSSKFQTFVGLTIPFVQRNKCLQLQRQRNTLNLFFSYGLCNM